MEWFITVVGAFVLFVLFTAIFLASRYKRCPSDEILVVYADAVEPDAMAAIESHYGLRLLQDVLVLEGAHVVVVQEPQFRCNGAGAVNSLDRLGQGDHVSRRIHH